MSAPRPPRPAPPAYVDTPAGLLSAGGVHYRTTEALLRAFAGPVADRVGLAPLVRAADAWTEAPRVVTAAALLGGLAVLPPAWAAVGALVAGWAATLAAPGLASQRLAGLWHALSGAAAQGLAFAVGLSALGLQGQTAAVAVGLAGFVALRLGAVERGLRPLAAPVLRLLYALPPADQTLRSVVVRAAIRHGLSLTQTADMEAQVRAFWKR